ncbi:MAG: hypothetical protein WCD76_12905, partial [Pyrinomonadaceae bacterium]
MTHRIRHLSVKLMAVVLLCGSSAIAALAQQTAPREKQTAPPPTQTFAGSLFGHAGESKPASETRAATVPAPSPAAAVATVP